MREGAKGVWGKGPYSRGHSKVQGPRGTGLREELEEDPSSQWERSEWEGED